MNARDLAPPSDAERWRLEIIERRRAHAATFSWSVPGLAIAGQAFLLSVALRPDVTSVARLFAALAGCIAAIAATHLYAKQIYLFDLYEAFLEGERQRLGLPGLQTDELLAAGPFPSNTKFAQQKWGETGAAWYWLIVRWRSAFVWLVALTVFVLIDGALLVYSILALVGHDPHWLGRTVAH